MSSRGQNHPQLRITAIDPKRQIHFFFLMVETKLYCLQIHIQVIKQKEVTSRKDKIVTIWGLEGEGGLCLEWGPWKDFQRQDCWQSTIAQPELGGM